MNRLRETSRGKSRGTAGTDVESHLRSALEPPPEAVRRIVHAALYPPDRSPGSGRVPGLAAAGLAVLLVSVALLFPQRSAAPPELEGAASARSELRSAVTILGTGTSIVITPSPQSLRAAESADDTAEAGGSILLIRRRSS
jgi:hypothetical protein